MADNFTIRVFTPEGLLLEDVSSDVRLQGAAGEVGILPNHANYIGLLGTGVLEYHTHPGRELRRLVVAEGVCTFGDDMLTILADRIVTADAADVLALEDERAEALAALASGSVEDPERIQAGKRLAYVNAVEKLLAE